MQPRWNFHTHPSTPLPPHTHIYNMLYLHNHNKWLTSKFKKLYLHNHKEVVNFKVLSSIITSITYQEVSSIPCLKYPYIIQIYPHSIRKNPYIIRKYPTVSESNKIENSKSEVSDMYPEVSMECQFRHVSDMDMSTSQKNTCFMA